jgi:hypothetical protein
MSSTEPAFGGMFRRLIELGVTEINTEPLDAVSSGVSSSFGRIHPVLAVVTRAL